MPADFTIGQGNTEPIFARQILDSTGSPVALVGATVTLQLRALISPTPLTLTGTVEIFDAPNGRIQWKPSTQDTAISGMYMGKWHVVYANGATQDYPTDGYEWVLIEPSPATLTGQYLVGLPEVKDYILANGGNIGRNHDAKLLEFAGSVTPLIENVVGPTIVRTVEEWHDGGQSWITLRRKPSFALGTDPVLNIVGCDEYRGPTKYTLQIVADPTQASTYSAMLDQRTGTLYRRTTGGGVVPFGAGPWGGGMPQAVHVIYQTGQNTIPANVRMAALEAIRWNYMSTQPTGTGSRSIADGMDTTPGPHPFVMPPSAMEYLSPMRRRPAIA